MNSIIYIKRHIIFVVFISLQTICGYGAFFHANLNEGSLRDLLGDQLLQIDSLSIEGSIDIKDFSTIWEAAQSGAFEISYPKGKLVYVDLRDAIFENNRVPAYALCKEWGMCGHEHLQLKTILLPDEIEVIGEYAFNSISDIIDMPIPSNLRLIEKYGMNGTYATDVDKVYILPNGLEELEEYAFTVFAKSVEIPSSLRYLYDTSLVGVFEDGLYVKSIVPPVVAKSGRKDYIFDRDMLQNLFVPEGSLELYKNDPFWNNYANIIETRQFPSGYYYNDKVNDLCGLEYASINCRNGILRIIFPDYNVHRISVITIDGNSVFDGHNSGRYLEVNVPKGIIVIKIDDNTYKFSHIDG